jgi:hypothetical protein
MGMRFTIKYSKNPEIPVQTFKTYNKRTMVRYKSNSSQDLCIEEVRNVFREKAVAHHKTLSEHPNPLIGPLTEQPKQRRLKRSWTFDEIN